MKLQGGVWVSFLKSTCQLLDQTCILGSGGSVRLGLGLLGTPSSVTINSGLEGLSGCTRSHVCIRCPYPKGICSLHPQLLLWCTTSSSDSFDFFRINGLASACTMDSKS